MKFSHADKDEDGNILAVHVTYDPASRGGNSPDGRKVKGTIHWVSAEKAVDAEVRLYDRLFAAENPSDERGVESFEDHLNPDSLVVLTGCKLEETLEGAKPGETFQFMRNGYFTVDPDTTENHLVFNRTVALKDSWQRPRNKARIVMTEKEAGNITFPALFFARCQMEEKSITGPSQYPTSKMPMTITAKQIAQDTP